MWEKVDANIVLEDFVRASLTKKENVDRLIEDIKQLKTNN